ncbi:MAG: 50S ribosomal protein L35 [Bacilli bacterium]|nr:50S ribosomal protein L35 [Bacilli bacterium]
MSKKIKAKTHKGLSKVLKVRKGGSVKFQPANKNHKLTHKSNASRRRRHHESELSSADNKRLKTIINN